MIRKLTSILLRFTLIPFLIREFIQRKKVTIIFYHEIKPDKAERHFKTLKSKYNVISLREYIKARKSGKVGELPPKPLIITFDDGFKENYELKAIFKKHKIPATIFLCSGIVGTKRRLWWKNNIDHNTIEYLKNIPDEERLEVLRKFGFEERKEFEDRQALSIKEIEEMKNIVDFQSHTIFHPILTKCSLERSSKEISQSKIDLENNHGLSIYALSYPNGNYSDREIAIAKKAGYECAVTVDLGFNSQKTDLFRLKRICIDDVADTNELLARASGLWDFILGFGHKTQKDI